MRFALVLFLIALAGCSSGKADFEKLCNAEQLSGAAAEKDPSSKAQMIAMWAQANVGGEGKKFMQSISASGGDKGALLKQAAHEAGYDGPCPLADMK